MTKSQAKPTIAAKSLALAATIAAGSGIGAAQAQVLPTNPPPDMTCVVAPTEFSTWFKSGTPSLNGPVVEADSVNLNTDNNCNFYKWSEQMFLWLTSPATGPYQGNRVLDSQIFYQRSGNTMKPQTGGGPLVLGIRTAQVGPDGLPIVVDAAGHVREFVIAPAPLKAVKLKAGAKPSIAQVAGVRRGPAGKAVLVDTSGKPVQVTPAVTAAMLPANTSRLARMVAQPTGTGLRAAAVTPQRLVNALNEKHILIRFGSGTSAVFVEAGTGTIDDLEPGQAGGNGVLLSQNGSVIFYETLVNDVYAWYLTGRKTPTAQGGIAPYYYGCQPIGSCAFQYGLFPTSSTDLNAILKFADAHGVPPTDIPDQKALAVEAKLSWVDASTLPSAQGYITAQAMVPTYNTSNPTNWTPGPPKLVTVALVGAHFVGSTAGHPEMVWATFEHQANTPLATYQYNSGGVAQTVSQSTAGTWLFSASNASAPFNTVTATYKAPNIVATAPPAPISASNILREKAWGVSSIGQPNQEDPTPAASNTEIISIDTNIRNQLAAAGASADPRYNYLMIGSTWTFGGGQPNGPYPVDPGVNDEIGTSMLANSTMETFHQGADTTYNTGLTCFTCHSDNGTNPQVKASTLVSHIFDALNPFPLTNKAAAKPKNAKKE
jgi:hypothetical protein